MHPLSLLQLLADGKFHSGDALGQTLGVSRVAIWKAVNRMRLLGIDVHKVRGKGYRMSPPVELLDSSSILQELKDSNRLSIQEVEILVTVDSTNSLMIRRIQDQELKLADNSLYLCLAEQQTAGKGRRGRTWISPFGRNMYLSLVKEFTSGVVALEGLSLVVAIALVRALKKMGIEGLGVKWPNDVLCDNRKLAGILLEMMGDVTGDCLVVIGLGLNIGNEQGAARLIDQPWIDLESINPSLPPRNRIIGQVIDSLLDVLAEFEQRGFSSFRNEWMALDAYLGCTVEIGNPGSGQTGKTGIVRGVTEHGALELELETGVTVFNGGEISIKKKGER